MCAPPSTTQPGSAVVSGPMIALGWTTVNGHIPRDCISPANRRRTTGLAMATTYRPSSACRGYSTANADFHAASSTLVSGELVAESSVAPPGDGDGGEFGLA